ncbi:hsp70 family protein [Massilia sp. UMI-21]|nr:hsp70 family protein [Massilia sp. UMI-21]
MTQYLVSIDLGTTNTVLAYALPGAGPGTEVDLFAIDQLVAPGEVAAAPLLPSMRYHPAEGELAPGELQLPWLQQDPAGVERVAVGRLARLLGAQTPGRLVASAKSWLSHAGVDRMAPILPWGAEDADVSKVSPVAASASYLAHLRAAWNLRFPKAPLERQQIVLTVPASFDEGARALTLEAARMAGLPELRLLEEPQAALYDWLYRHRATLADDLAGTRLVLVADVGGGTTDFSLVKVELEADGQPKLTRIGVGNHLILGGDNMDLALAHLAESRLKGDNATERLSAGRLAQLTERCRAAKEQLLAPDAPEQVNVTLLGSGARLIGASRSATITREDVQGIVLDGFFPPNEAQEGARRARAGIVEFGLPYASDPAITRHLAAFLRQHAQAAREALGKMDTEDDGMLPVPDALLLNGGVFRGAALARRLADVLSNWRGAPVRVLHNDDPDVAVARGGVAYSLARSGQAPSIESGSARNYYLLLDAEQSGDTLRAVCLLPRGAPAGEELRLAGRSFALRLGRPVRFHLVSSTADPGGILPQPGDLLDLPAADIVRLPAISTVLRSKRSTDIPVQLAAVLSEVGTLEVFCVAEEDPKESEARRWRLEFQLRGQEEEEPLEEAALPPELIDAIARIDRIFGNRSQQVEPREVRQLRATLEQLLGARERWTTPLLRRLFDALLARARGRRRSAEHERAWLNLAGYCLRPGFGHPLDEWRIEQLWAMFEPGVQYHKDGQVRAEWWTLWRRVAGGLSLDAQLRLLDDFAFNLQADAAERGRRPVTLVDGSEDDMLRMGASLERIPSAYKAEIGDWLIGQIMAMPAGARIDARAAARHARYLWALGRVGARQSFHGAAHEVAPGASAEAWLNDLFQLDWKKIEPAGFAAAHIARMTGDRSRDIGQPVRDEVLRRLAASGAPPAWPAMVREVVELDQAVETRMLGDALPPGLKLLR